MAREPNVIIRNDSMHLIDPTSKQLLNKAELLNLIDNEEHVVYELESDSVYPVFRKCTTHNIKQDLLSLPLNHNNSLAGILYQEYIMEDGNGISGHFTNFYRIDNDIIFLDGSNGQTFGDIPRASYQEVVYYYYDLEDTQKTNTLNKVKMEDR